MKQLKVSAIREGTVIDHIPSDVTFKVVEILKLNSVKEIISVAANLDSKKIGKKGIIKIGGKFLGEEEVNKIALVAPAATLSIIKDFKVVEKNKLTIPKTIEGFVKCFNPNCITNHEEIKTKFHVANQKPLKIRCHYCERAMASNDIVLK
ncbi:aspartate carbamoyltransferase regulatory subunit [Candidatus Woesearchaeota archaeon]|nr:aspartate carbamoyltransferase regulatory subunit [Candidatus Woesearchaeota archaeon]